MGSQAATILAQRSDELEAECRRVLTRLHSGPVPAKRVKSGVVRVLVDAYLATQGSGGCLELTRRGLELDPAAFQVIR
jgi:hypothetical protein